MEIAHDNGMLPLQTYNDAEDEIRAVTKHCSDSHSILQAAVDNYPWGGDSDIYRIIHDAIAEAQP